MTLHILMEPLTGLAFHTRKRSAVMDASCHPADPESLWAIRVTEWHTTRDDVLPAGMQIVATANQRQAAGRMTGGRIAAWVDQLAAAGLDAIAKAVTETMAAHLAPPPVWTWGCQHQWRLDFSRQLIMGILNVTVDSFSGDGLAGDLDAAVARGLAMSAAGADLLDVGGESTRPGAMPVATEIELQRVVSVIQALSRHVTIPISVDTSKPEVMTAALDAGAALINDVTALRGPESQQTARMLAQRQIPVILMHMQQTPLTMQQAPVYQDVVGEVYDFMAQRIAFCEQQGMDRRRLLLDPGIGFGKTTQHNLTLLQRSRVWRGLGLPLLLGVSRKQVVGALTGEIDPNRRDVGSHVLGTLVDADILRVHDVAGARQAQAVATGFTQAPLEAAA